MNFNSRDNWVDRRDAPIVSVYLVNSSTQHPPHKLSCMFCKRTIADGVKGEIDRIIDGPVPDEDFGTAMNIQCKLCGQKWRILGSIANSVQG